MFNVALFTVACGLIFKLISALEASNILLPLAAVASFYHLKYHALANKSDPAPLALLWASNVAFLMAIMLQIDFQFADGCGWDTYWGIKVRLGLEWDRGCYHPVGVAGIVTDVLFYIPVASTWWKLAKHARKAATGHGSTAHSDDDPDAAAPKDVDPTQSRYRGMTVNERLVASGQIEAWDAAVASGDRALMVDILLMTNMTIQQASETADIVLANQ